MANQKKGSVRVEKKGDKYGTTYEVPGDLTDKEKIAYAKKILKSRSKKRPYGMKYIVKS